MAGTTPRGALRLEAGAVRGVVVQASLQGDAGFANDLTPLGDFDFDPMRELIWCTGDWIEAKREQAVVELGGATIFAMAR